LASGLPKTAPIHVGARQHKNQSEAKSASKRGRVRHPRGGGYFVRPFLLADVVSWIWVTWSKKIVQHGGRKTPIWGMKTGKCS